MKKNLYGQLELLSHEMIIMGTLCEEAISGATRALLEGNARLAAEMIDNNKTINQKERDIEALCLRLFLQQPVACDLRAITSALKMITDLSRIGNQATDICETLLMQEKTTPVTTAYFKEMAEATIKMVSDAIDAYSKKDFVLATEVVAYDDIVDEYFVKTKNNIADLFKEAQTEMESNRALDLLMIAKYFERIGDHAVNIGQWVEYSATGCRGESEL